MEWRGIAAKVLVFVVGAAGVVLAVFVVAPRLEAPDQSAAQPLSRDAIVEEVLASFGEEDAGEDGQADAEAVKAAGLLAIPSPLLPTAVENPVPGPAMEPPAAAETGQLGAAVAQGAGLPEVLSPEEVGTVMPEPARAASAPHVQTDDGPLADGPLAVEAERITEPMLAAPEATAPYEAVEEPEPEPAEPVRDAQQLYGEVLQETESARQSSRAGLPRLEFEAPCGIQVVETPPGAEDPSSASEPTAASAVEPRSEFSPRPFVHSVAPAAVETVPPSGGPAETAHSAGRAGPPPSDPVRVPHTLRGVMGYRMPLVSRQEMPDQIVSGVLIPAHTTYVILQPGYWELVGLSPDDVKALRAFAEKTKADPGAELSQPPARGWNRFRLFRAKRAPADGN